MPQTEILIFKGSSDLHVAPHTPQDSMVAQRLSPTGNLFRNSRLFSLPPPLVSPTDKITTTRRYDSETATLPYPTQQALETTPSSLARGDWGLKRSLPLKSTARTSTPTIKIRDIDSINHITDFDSAADHVLNLRKWQEIGLPVSRVDTTRRVFGHASHLRTHKSVFEADYDNTLPESSSQGLERWKYRGPWIAGQTAGDFNHYKEHSIKRQRQEFRNFLRERLREKIAAEDRLSAINNGVDLPDEPPMIDEERLNHHIKELRQDQSRLFRLIEEFLDLPGGMNSSSEAMSDTAWQSSESGPPTTHPSAGLSYLRGRSYTFNHPALGPQDKGQPVRARVLAVRDRNSQNSNITVGVGGIAIEDPRFDKSTLNASRKGLPKGTAALDQDVLGGAKIWVQPDETIVDTQGRIQVRASPADPRTTALYEQSEQSNEDEMPDPLANANRRVPDLTSITSRNRNSGASHTYGINKKDSEPRKPPRRSERPAPFSSQQDLLDLLGGIGDGHKKKL